MHPHDATTVRTLVVFVRGCRKGISKAGKIHGSLSQLAVGRFVCYLKAIRWPEAGPLVMVDWTPQPNPQPRQNLMAKKGKCEV